jgi:hypothetical protein
MLIAADAATTAEIQGSAVTTSENEFVPVIIVTETPFSVTAVTVIT